MGTWGRFCAALRERPFATQEYIPPIRSELKAPCERSVRQCIEAMCEQDGERLRDGYSLDDVREPSIERALSYHTLIPFCNTFSYEKSGMQIARHWRHAIRYIREFDPCNMRPPYLRDEAIRRMPERPPFGMMREVVDPAPTLVALMEASAGLIGVEVERVDQAFQRAHLVAEKLRDIGRRLELGEEVTAADEYWFLNALQGEVGGYDTKRLVGVRTYEYWQSCTVDAGIEMADGSLRWVGPNHHFGIEDVPISWYATGILLFGEFALVASTVIEIAGEIPVYGAVPAAISVGK